jgi:hypothetical protein
VPPGRLDFIIGSASASAAASAPFDLSPVDPPTTLPTSGGAVARLPGPASGGAALPPARVPSSATPPRAAPSPGPVAAPAASSGPAPYSFDGVPLPLAVGGFLLAVPGARRIRRYVERLMTLTTA